MPALRMYGRRWHTTTDMVPVPSLAGVVFHGAWVIIFGSLVGHFHVWETCSGDGLHYIIVTAGLFGVFAYSFVAEAALTVLGCRGDLINRIPSPAPNFATDSAASIVGR